VPPAPRVRLSSARLYIYTPSPPFLISLILLLYNREPAFFSTRLPSLFLDPTGLKPISPSPKMTYHGMHNPSAVHSCKFPSPPAAFELPSMPVQGRFSSVCFFRAYQLWYLPYLTFPISFFRHLAYSAHGLSWPSFPFPLIKAPFLSPPPPSYLLFPPTLPNLFPLPSNQSPNSSTTPLTDPFP